MYQKYNPSVTPVELISERNLVNILKALGTHPESL